jgi:hypothetical protein
MARIDLEFGDEIVSIPPGSLTAAAEPGLPDRVMAHLPVAEAASEPNGRAAAQALQQVVLQNKSLLEAAGHRATSASSSVMMLRHVAGEWSTVAARNSACRSGCSHCCHIGVHIPETEAKLIAKKTGARLAEPAQSWLVFQQAPPFAHGYDKPCVFLAAGRCTIYEHRPLACRRLINLDSVDLLCQLIPGHQPPVPRADARVFDALFLLVTSRDRLADIRDWFPDGR